MPSLTRPAEAQRYRDAEIQHQIEAYTGGPRGPRKAQSCQPDGGLPKSMVLSKA